MSATITLAKEKETGLIQHINDVVKEKGLLYRCVGCDKEVIVVKSKPRKKEWHFRHKVESSCTGGRDTALHDYAVQILINNSAVKVSKKLEITYTNPRKEVSFLGKRSDVTVTYENEDIHFEVYVTHDLDPEKIDIYKNYKKKCVKIDLSEPGLLTATPEKIKEAVLSQHRNKTIIFWKDEVLTAVNSNERNFNWKHLLIVIAAFIGLRYLWKLLFRPKRRNFR